jgi:hypothetical protein
MGTALVGEHENSVHDPEGTLSFCILGINCSTPPASLYFGLYDRLFALCWAQKITWNEAACNKC